MRHGSLKIPILEVGYRSHGGHGATDVLSNTLGRTRLLAVTQLPHTFIRLIIHTFRKLHTPFNKCLQRTFIMLVL